MRFKCRLLNKTETNKLFCRVSILSRELVFIKTDYCWSLLNKTKLISAIREKRREFKKINFQIPF